MSLLRALLIDKKIFEAVEEVDEFIENNDVEPGSLVQRIEFDKEFFKNEDSVNDFMVAHVFSDHRIEDMKKKKRFSVTLLGEEGFIDSTIKEIPLRDGVIIVVGILRPMTSDNPFFMSLQDGEKTFKLSADIPYVIDLVSVVEGFHPVFGDVVITKETLLKFKENFDNRAFGVDISIDFDHEVREAAGWIKEVFLSIDEKTLHGVVRWTPKGALALSDKEFRYFSPEYSLNFIHPHDKTEFGPTLVGGALTNRPFLKMPAMVGLTNKQIMKGDVVETIKMSEHNEKVGVLATEIQTLKLDAATTVNVVTSIKAENKQLSEDNKNLKESAEKAEKDVQNNLLFSEGKINKAQLTALNEGKDLYEVLQMNDKLNTKPAGDGSDVTVTVTLSDKELKLCKGLGLTPEEFVKHNKAGE